MCDVHLMLCTATPRAVPKEDVYLHCIHRTLLGARLSQLSVMRGESTRHKLLLVKDVSPAAVFDKLQSQLQKQKK